MMALKDPIMNKKSVTVNLLVVTFLLVASTIICRLAGILDDSGVIYAVLAFHLPYVGVYWNKRARISKDGVDFGNDNFTS